MHTILREGDNEIHSSKRYLIASDLHLEWRVGQEKVFWDSFPSPAGIRTCICAGDLTSFGLPDGVVWEHFTGLCNRFDKVIFTVGNHEYYQTNIEDVQRRLGIIEKQLSPVLKVLRTGESYVYEGQRFLGGEMWFPDIPEVHIYRRLVNDSIQIKGLFPWAFTQSHLFMTYLKEHVKESDIIVTHHVPIDVDTLPRWKGSNTQAYFLNKDCDRYLSNPITIKPKAWIYGHTHDAHDYYAGRTHFICRPLGYPGENGYMPTAVEPCVFEI